MERYPEAKHNWMRIKELAERAGVSRYTIHYYLNENLLPPPLKTGRTMALYTAVHLECLRFIRTLREEQGMPIAAVRREVRLRFGEQWRTAGLVSVSHAGDLRLGPKGNVQRQRIIETALELFSQKGYHRTHVSHITDALRISKGTFYLYFENKHDLFVAVFDHLIEVLTSTEERIAGETDVAARMRERARAYFSFYKRYHKVFDIIRAESIGQEGRPELSIQAVYRKILDPLAEDIRKAQEDGLIPDMPGDPELRSYMLFGSFDFVCYRLLMDDKYSLDEILDIFTRTPQNEPAREAGGKGDSH